MVAVARRSVQAVFIAEIIKALSSVNPPAVVTNNYDLSVLFGSMAILGGNALRRELEVLVVVGCYLVRCQRMLQDDLY